MKELPAGPFAARMLRGTFRSGDGKDDASPLYGTQQDKGCLMERDNRRSSRQLVLGALIGMALTGFAPSTIAAQGIRAEQRAACEEEAKWLCNNYVPDEEAIKACMLRNLRALSPRCRAMFRRDAEKKRRPR
jgi:hypothetical protein